MKRLMSFALSLLLLTGCASAPAGQRAAAAEPEADVSSTRHVEAMDTIMALSAYGSNREKALDAAEAEILRLDALLSTGKPDSEVSELNRTGTVTLSEDSKKLVNCAFSLHEETDGAFDVTVYPLMQLWGFPEKEYHLPTQEELADALARVGMDRLRLEGDTLSLDEGQEIDLGGIGKGYTSQRVMEVYRQAGVTSGLVSLGGNVQCLGTKPDGSLWRVGIQDPWKTEGEIAAVVEVQDQAVITSGGYERYFVDESTGETYCHILDPKTGWPVKSGLASVSIVSPDGMLADGLSTSLYILGLEGATQFWRDHSEQFQAIFIDNQGQIFVTEGLKDAVQADAGFTVIPQSEKSTG